MTPTTKTVLVTGSTRGIGLTLAELYVQRGWNVIGTARDPTKAHQLRALSPYKIVQLDSSDEASIVRAAKELECEPIDLLINNAGIFLGGGLNETTKLDIMTQFEVNAVGPFLVTRAFIPHMKAAVEKNGAATVAQISSRVGSIERTGSGHVRGYYGYRASKAALNIINASLALDLKEDGIAGFVLHPGHVATDFNNHQGTISTETSASGLIAVIEKLTVADTGKFFDYNGESLPW